MGNSTLALYSDPEALNPLFPDDPTGKLEGLAVELIRKSARLSATMHPVTRRAIAEFLGPMNSYYSNLIEGHDTHPIDIAKALIKDYSANKEQRSLQLEAKAHIAVFRKINNADRKIDPVSTDFIKNIHEDFYAHLPDDFRLARTTTGDLKVVEPGEFRDCEVEVGRHIAPHFKALPQMMEKFEFNYSSKNPENKSQIRRIISIAASHHRLAWIHPFLDGNGRVVRLYSDAMFVKENLHAEGLWSISRGLAKANNEYKEKLANADLERQGNYDGRGNLSNKFLVQFCEFFLKTAIDQVDFMYSVMDVEGMLARMSSFVDLMVARGKMKSESKFILIDVFLKGYISTSDAMRITGTSDKTSKRTLESLLEMGFLDVKRSGKSILYFAKYPLIAYPILFPGVYPKDKELDILQLTL